VVLLCAGRVLPRTGGPPARRDRRCLVAGHLAIILTGYSNARSEGYNRLAKYEGRNAFASATPTNHARMLFNFGSHSVDISRNEF